MRNGAPSIPSLSSSATARARGRGFNLSCGGGLRFKHTAMIPPCALRCVVLFRFFRVWFSRLLWTFQAHLQGAGRMASGVLSGFVFGLFFLKQSERRWTELKG